MGRECQHTNAHRMCPKGVWGKAEGAGKQERNPSVRNPFIELSSWALLPHAWASVPPGPAEMAPWAPPQPEQAAALDFTCVCTSRVQALFMS